MKKISRSSPGPGVRLAHPRTLEGFLLQTAALSDYLLCPVAFHVEHPLMKVTEWDGIAGRNKYTGELKALPAEVLDTLDKIRAFEAASAATIKMRLQHILYKDLYDVVTDAANPEAAHQLDELHRFVIWKQKEQERTVALEKAAVSPATETDARKAARARIRLGQVLLAAGRGDPDPEGVAAAALFANDPTTTKAKASAVHADQRREIKREIDRVLGRIGLELLTWANQTDKGAASYLLIVYALMVEAIIDQRVYDRVKDHLNMCGKNYEQVTIAVEKLWAEPGRMNLASIIFEERSQPGGFELTFAQLETAKVWLIRRLIDFAKPIHAKGETVRQIPEPAYHVGSILFREIAHAGKKLASEPLAQYTDLQGSLCASMSSNMGTRHSKRRRNSNV